VEDPVDSLIGEIMTALAAVRLEGDRSKPVELAIGNLEKNEHSRPPRIAWIAGEGVLEQTTIQDSGGVSSAVLTDTAICKVFLWGETKYETRRLMHDLVRAGRRLARPDTFKFGAYEFVTESAGKHEHAGFGTIVLDCRLSVPITSDTPEQTENTVEIARTAFRVGIANPAGEDEDESEYDVIRAPEDWT
jgi:hypothetical protein